MKKPCKTCPFIAGTENIGAPDWVMDVFNGIKSGNLDHSCHVVDPKADGYIGGKEQMCWGFLGMMKKFDGSCTSQKALKLMQTGELDWAHIPTDKVFDHPLKMIMHHAERIGAETK